MRTRYSLHHLGWLGTDMTNAFAYLQTATLMNGIDAAHFIGLVAGKVVDNPTKYADVVTATTHKALRGPRGGIILTREEFAKDIDKNMYCKYDEIYQFRLYMTKFFNLTNPFC